MATPPKKPAGSKKPAKTAAKKPVARKAAPKAKVVKKAAPKPAAAAPKVSSTPHVAPPPPQPIKLVTPASRHNADLQVYWDTFIEYAQENPAVTFVGIIATVLGLVLLFG